MATLQQGASSQICKQRPALCQKVSFHPWRFLVVCKVTLTRWLSPKAADNIKWYTNNRLFLMFQSCEQCCQDTFTDCTFWAAEVGYLWWIHWIKRRKQEMKLVYSTRASATQQWIWQHLPCFWIQKASCRDGAERPAIFVDFSSGWKYSIM